jgi:cation diffusion facilitator CzcD-associated flavoprotein CzcO
VSEPRHVDVLIVGAGLSGIGAAAHLQAGRANSSFVILEARDAIGGTWDLFRYPGIRSDSDMYTLGYAFKPWTSPKAIADGAAICQYIRDTAAEHGIDRHVRFGHKVVAARWATDEALWRVEVDTVGGPAIFTCRFLVMAAGYYDYDEGHRPHWPGEADFAGPIVHPQFWPEGLDCAGKWVAVIGSGATAVTLVPEIARTAAHVTMVQRSPSYIVSRPAVDGIAEWLKRWMPARPAYVLTRWKNVLLGWFFYRLARARPEKVADKLIELAKGDVGERFDPSDFTPPYKPWDQRLCLVPDGDLFAAIREGRVTMATGSIARFTKSGLILGKGETVSADIIVAATGLKIVPLGKVAITVDGRPAELPGSMAYKGMMLSGVPNMMFIFGYTNASWTLKADLACAWLVRLLDRMDRTGARMAVARRDSSVEEIPFLDFTSGYVRRALTVLPKQGARRPWRLYQNYLLDLLTLRFGRIEDGTLVLGRREQAGKGAPVGSGRPAPARALSPDQ